MRRWTEVLAFVLLFALAAWQFDGLGAAWSAPIPHGPDEDWDWQLTLWQAGLQCVRAGELPGWNPWTGGGLPLWAHPESPFLYPPWWLSLWLGTDLTIKLILLGHLALLVVGAGLAGRELGLPVAGAQFAALFALCSAFLPDFIAYGHIMFVGVGWLPLAWVALRRGRWAWAGVALAMPLLSGGHYLALYGVLWLILDGLSRALQPERSRWLCAVLALNGLALGLGWLAWPLGAALLLALAVQRPARGATLWPLVGALAVAGLLMLPKLGPMVILLGKSARMSAQASFSVADPYTLPELLRVLSGWVPRPSGHEGPNVFFSPIPVLLGLVGLGVVGWRRPDWGLTGWVFWNLGWGGATPLNLLALVHRLPGFELIRVVERYSLIWTLFLGWSAGALLSLAWSRSRVAGALLALTLLSWVPGAARSAAGLQRMGPGPSPAIAAGDFVQVRGEGSNYHSVLANQGRPDRSTSGAPPAPAAGLRAVGEEGYKGEAWLLETGEPLQATLSPGRVRLVLPRAGTAVLNQNAWPGWRSERGQVDTTQGLVSVHGEAGQLELRYSVPWLRLSSAISLVGLVALGLLAGRMRTRDSTEPSSHS